MKSDSKFINRFVKLMTKIMISINPKWDKDKVKDIIYELVDVYKYNPQVFVVNNYTHEERDTSLLSVLDWVIDKEPIICGNATFYKNQHQLKNPIALMLEGFLSERKRLKKLMFKEGEENGITSKYKDLDRGQLNEKVNANAYYGASGMKQAAFYSEFSGPATTYSAQSVISTAEQMFEGFIADNYIFLNIEECLEWLETVRKEMENIDEFLQLKPFESVLNRLYNKILNKSDVDEEILDRYLDQFTNKELAFIYYKNNLIEFIRDHDEIQEILFEIFESVKAYDYVEKGDDRWIDKIPNKFREDFLSKTYKDWNSFVNKEYFMDPNDVPKSIRDPLSQLNDYILKYVYVRYLSFDKIYRLKNFNRKVVTVIDTDSNILSLDPLVNFIFDEVIRDSNFGRSKMNNEFICINTICYLLTNAVTDILLYYGKCSNIPEEYRPIYNMKNEFYFSRLIIGHTKKRYISKILLREGNLMNPPKYDIKGLTNRPHIKKFILENKVNCWKVLKEIISSQIPYRKGSTTIQLLEYITSDW